MMLMVVMVVVMLTDSGDDVGDEAPINIVEREWGGGLNLYGPVAVTALPSGGARKNPIF